ncbi:unnamed protein product [Linum tenue]|uniref:Uncharacterized protein n=1 Tax=Linum tenue TaxID=586396 RepID=A0AAV0QVU1_9ROSI|nr:unnamed protein product [Linum tenue]
MPVGYFHIYLMVPMTKFKLTLKLVFALAGLNSCCTLLLLFSFPHFGLLEILSLVMICKLSVSSIIKHFLIFSTC